MEGITLYLNKYTYYVIGTGYSSKKFECDYGLKILKMMGWKDGSGLGREENGITECIQAKRRHDNLGVPIIINE